jgi:hypothetical protein
MRTFYQQSIEELMKQPPWPLAEAEKHLRPSTQTPCLNWPCGYLVQKSRIGHTQEGYSV